MLVFYYRVCYNRYITEKENKMRDINEWVFSGDGGTTDNWNKQNGLWTETNEKTYWDMMEIVPPAVMKNGDCFMVGEASTHDEKGFPVYTVFIKINDRYFAKDDSVNGYNFYKYVLQIKNQFKME